MQNGEIVQLGRCVLAEEDQHALLDEIGDQRPDLRDHRGVPDGLAFGGGHCSTSAMSSAPTPETKLVSLMKLASGPDGEAAWISTVRTFFIG